MLPSVCTFGLPLLLVLPSDLRLAILRLLLLKSTVRSVKLVNLIQILVETQDYKVNASQSQSKAYGTLEYSLSCGCNGIKYISDV